ARAAASGDSLGRASEEFCIASDCCASTDLLSQPRAIYLHYRDRIAARDMSPVIPASGGIEKVGTGLGKSSVKSCWRWRPCDGHPRHCIQADPPFESEAFDSPGRTNDGH